MKRNECGTAGAFAPATVSNVVCGYDIFGFAMREPGDEVRARLVEEPGVRITAVHGDGGRLPLDAERNTAGVAVSRMLEKINAAPGVELELFKKMPLGSGMGSSAASAAAAVLAVNHILGEPLSRKDLLPFCLSSERAACGAGHVDNAAPSLLGGFILVRSYDPLDVVSLPVPSGLYCALIHPHMEINTGEARRMLPPSIPLAEAVRQWGNVSGFTAGLLQGDFDLIRRSLEDFIVEPVRSVLLPHYRDTRRAAMEAGALGCGISGSGPSMFALASSLTTARKVLQAMEEVSLALGLACEGYLSPLPQAGARIIGVEP